MDNRYRVGKPKEGLNTLVARFSFTHFDRAVEKIKTLRRQGESEDQIPTRSGDPCRSGTLTVERGTWNVELIILSVC